MARQACYAVLRGKLFSADYRRQLLTTADGGTIALDWFRGCDESGALPQAAPILVVLHGLTGAFRPLPLLHAQSRVVS